MARSFKHLNKYTPIVNTITSLVFPVVDSTTGDTLDLKLDSHDAMVIIHALREYLPPELF